MNTYIEREKEYFSKTRFLDKYMENHSGFIAGGCFKNIFTGTKVKDIDIFFKNELDFTVAVENFYADDDYVFSYENTNTVSFKNKETNVRVEFIRSQFGTPEEILEKFDFSITKFAYCKKELQSIEFTAGSMVYYNYFIDRFFEDLVNKKLVIGNELLFPISTFERSYRYRGYGYGLCKESKGKLIDALQGANLNDLSNDLYFGLD